MPLRRARASLTHTSRRPHARGSDRFCGPLPHRPRQQGFAQGLPARRPERADHQGRPGQGPGARPHDDQRPDARLRAPRRRGRQQHGPRGRHPARLRRDPRHHDHPLLLLLGADLPDGLPRDQGRRGRRLHLRRRRDGLPLRQGHLRPHPRHPQPAVRGGAARAPTSTRRAARTGTTRATTAKLPDIYIAMGQTAENVARMRGLDRKELDEFGVRSQNLAEKAINDGFWANEITPVTTPDGTMVVERRRPARRRHLRGDLPAQAGLPPRRRGDGRQLLPAQRRRGRGDHHVRHQGQGARPHAAGPDRLHRRHRPLPRDHGPRPGRGDQAGAEARRT